MDIKYFKLGELKNYARNPRKNNHAVQKMAQAITDYGFRVPILSKSDGTIVDGHLRVKAAQSLDLAEIPAILCDDLSESKIRCLRLSVNKMADIPDWGMDLLEAEVRELLHDGIDLGLTSFDEIEFKSLLLDDGFSEPEPPLEEAEGVPSSGIKDGDTIELGAHRVVCGDSTRDSYYKLLLGSKKADVVFIDPPYNAGYHSRSKNREEWGDILNDELDLDSYKDFLTLAFSKISEHTKDGASIYCCIDMPCYPTLLDCFCECFNHKTTVVWDKTHFGFGKHYRKQYELVVFGYKGQEIKTWNGGDSERDVWSIKRDPTKGYYHPTQKPVPLIKRALLNSSNRGDLVLDVFAGAGSTLLACEDLDRSAYLIEKEVKYVDVISARYRGLYG